MTKDIVLHLVGSIAKVKIQGDSKKYPSCGGWFYLPKRPKDYGQHRKK